MIVDVAYVTRSVSAAVGLALRDERAWSKFDLTVDGFFRSFAAMIPVIPLNIFIDLASVKLANGRRAEMGEALSTRLYGLDDAVFSTVTLIAQWLIFPIVTLVLLRFLQLSQRYSALIIAHNWATVVVVLVNLPAIVLFALGLASVDQVLNINFVVLGLTLYYRFYITQTALDAGWSLAAGITLLDFVLQIFFIFGVNQIAGLWLAPA